MKAIVKTHASEGLWLEEVPNPQIKHHEVLIKIKRTSICGTDIHLYLWDEWAQNTLPVGTTVGHEFYGEIVEVGKNVQELKVGQRVSGEGHITCGHCRQCRMGQRVICPNTIGVGVNRNGCFAEYLAIPAENVFPLSDDIPDDIASIFDPFGNAVHTALSFDLVGKDVLITGAGPIGLMAIPICQKVGARSVTITDINPYRLKMAEKMGATHAINVAKTPLTQEGQYQIALEMSGSPKAFASLPTLVSHGGHIVLLGILPSEVNLDWHKVIFKMLTIKGIYGREIFKTWYQASALIQSGVDLSPIITHKYPFEEFQKGFDTMLSGDSGKVVLEWA